MDIKYFWQIAEFEFMDEDTLKFFKKYKSLQTSKKCLFIYLKNKIIM